ncbi:MAG: class I SAM-dependent methyltransferase [Leptolyngbyaceae bacterium]|nr:class I SAM-dependent methyltransferase [Leptolyngbyaceae bacterium]
MKTFRAFLAEQLGLPSGWFGQLLLRLLNRRNAPMNDLVLSELQLQSGVRILEIGFGGGDLMSKLVKTGLPAQIVGVERSPDALKVCQNRFQRLIQQGAIEIHLADAAALPFPDQSFNQICTVNTLYFWSDAPQVLMECHRVLIPGSKLVIGYTSKTYLEQQKLAQHGFAVYEITEVEMMMSKAGFTQIKTVSGNSSHQEFFCTSGVTRFLI